MVDLTGMPKDKDLAPAAPERKVEKLSKQDPQAYINTTPEQQQAAKDALPPAGYRRDEVLAARQRELDAANTELATHDMLYTPTRDFAQMEDREILKHFERDPFSGEHNVHIEGMNTRDYAYALVLCKLPHSGRDHRMVTLAMRFGWEVVKPSTTHVKEDGKDVACGWNLPIVDELLNARGVADTVLMWMPRERYEALMELQRRHNARRTMAAQATSLFNAQGVRAHTELDDPRGYVRALVADGAAPMSQVPTMASAMSQGIAGKQLDEMIRQGNVPGVRIK